VGHDRDRVARGGVERLEGAAVGGPGPLGADDEVVVGVLLEGAGGV